MIIKQIENDLYSKWATGLLSFYQISKRLDALIEWLENQKESLKNLTNSANKNIGNQDKIIDETNSNWQSMGIGTKIAAAVFESIKDKRKSAFVEALQEKYRSKTLIKGYEYAALLYDDIINRISSVKKTITTINGTFSDIAKTFKTEISSKCNDDLPKAEKSNEPTIIKYYDAKKSREVAAAVVKDVTYRKDSIKNLRQSLFELMGENGGSFEKLKNLTKGEIINKLQNVAFSEVETLFKPSSPVSLSITGYERVVGDNIIGKLKQQYSGNKAGLKAKVKELVTQANALAKHNQSEANNTPIANDGKRVPIRTNLLLILPDYKDDIKFLAELENEFRGIDNSAEIQIEYGGKSNEIIIINLESCITPRYLESVKILRDSYKKLIATDGSGTAIFETHLETFPSNHLPSLYTPTGAEMKFEKEKLPILLLAKNLNLLQEYKNPETLKINLAILKKDEWGMDMPPVFLGKDVESSINVLTPEIVADLEKDVTTILKENYKSEEKQKELIKQINESDYEVIKKKYDSNLTNPTVVQFREAIQTCRNLVTKQI